MGGENMGVDPNDIVVDWGNQSTENTERALATSPSNNANPLITSCNEGVNVLVGHETFTYHDKANKEE